MPNPDGRIEAQDLCSQSVAERALQTAAVTGDKIANLAIGTAKIDNLAVETAKIGVAAITAVKVGDQEIDVQRLLEPVGADTEVELSQNVSLTSTETVHASTTLTVPSWAGTAYVQGISFMQMSSTGTHSMLTRCDVGGVPGSGAVTISATSNGTFQNINFRNVTISSPGATVALEASAWLSSSTNNNNLVEVSGAGTFLR